MTKDDNKVTSTTVEASLRDGLIKIMMSRSLTVRKVPISHWSVAHAPYGQRESFFSHSLNYRFSAVICGNSKSYAVTERLWPFKYYYSYSDVLPQDAINKLPPMIKSNETEIHQGDSPPPYFTGCWVWPNDSYITVTTLGCQMASNIPGIYTKWSTYYSCSVCDAPKPDNYKKNISCIS